MVKRWLYPLTVVIGLIPAASWAAGGVEAGGAATQSMAGSCGEAIGSSGRGLFSFGGESVGLDDLDINIRQALYELDSKYYQQLTGLLDNALWQVYLAREAKRQQKGEDQLARELISIEPPSESELKAFYDANREQIRTPYENVKGQLAQYMVQQRMLEQRARVLADLKQGPDFELLVPRPQPPVSDIRTDGFPARGGTLAAVEIVEFADYQCPHCKTGSEIMGRLEAKYGENIRVVFIDFPINRSGISRKVAEGGVCADQQGSFWPYHDRAFQQQATLSHESPTALADALGLDRERFSDCMAGSMAKEKVEHAKAEARRLGLNSTPTFFVNGVRVNTGNDMERALSDAIEQALKATKS